MSQPKLGKMQDTDPLRRGLLAVRSGARRALQIGCVVAIQLIFLCRNVLRLVSNAAIAASLRPLDALLQLVYWLSARFDSPSPQTQGDFDRLRQSLWNGSQVGGGGRLSTMLVPSEIDGYIDGPAAAPVAESVDAVCDSLEKLVATARELVDPMDTEADAEPLDILPRPAPTRRAGRGRDRVWWAKRRRRRSRSRSRPVDVSELKPLRIVSQPRRRRPPSHHGIRLAFDWRRPKSQPATPTVPLDSAAPIDGPTDDPQPPAARLA